MFYGICFKRLYKLLVVFVFASICVADGIASFASACTFTVSDAQVIPLGCQTDAVIRAEIDCPGEAVVQRVWCEIYAPSGASPPPELDLSDSDGDDVYEGTYTAFTEEGEYIVACYVQSDDVVHGPEAASVTTERYIYDCYEPDNGFDSANVIFIHNETQNHNFHDAGDNDWIKFFGVADTDYSIDVENLDIRSDAVIEVYNTDGQSKIAGPQTDYLDWKCTADGVYYVRIYNDDPNNYGEAVSYTLELNFKTAPLHGTISGIVKDGAQDTPLQDVRIKTTRNGSALSLDNGMYRMANPPGEQTLIAEFEGYQPFSTPIDLEEGGALYLNIDLTSADALPGDFDFNGVVDLNDAIIVFGILIGDPQIPVRNYLKADADGDGTVTINDALIILREIGL